MPNWCYNNVDITATTEEGKALLYRVSTAEAADGFFELLRPLGEWNYDRSVENWGTKWDVEPMDVDFDGTTMSTSFDSAWSPPIALYEYLKDQGFEVSASYYEPGMDFAGEWVDGEDFHLDDVSNLARQDEDTIGKREYDILENWNIFEEVAMWDEEDEEMDDSNDGES
jgi:hypothetical protein